MKAFVWAACRVLTELQTPQWKPRGFSWETEMNTGRIPLRYSQNFLYSKETVRKLLSIANIQKSDVLYEIGAGKGIITKELSGLCRDVFAIEFDKRLHSYLEKTMSCENVSHIYADVLHYQFPKTGKYKVFSNIPFCITSDILDKLLFSENPPVDSYFIIQKEAAMRYAGFPYQNDTLKSILLKPFFFFEILYDLKKTDFRPSPGVLPVLLRARKYHTFLFNRNDKRLYYDFVVYLFQKRTGSIMNRLNPLFTKKQLKRLSSKYDFNLNSGIRDLDYRQWISLFFYSVYNISEEKIKLTRNSYLSYTDNQSRSRKIHRARI